MQEYPTAEYLLVAEPHQLLCDEIMQVKKHFAETYECPAAATGRPNITLLRFQQYTMGEQKILHRLHVITAAQPSFIIELHDFGSFPTHSIYLNITTKTQLTELIKSLKPIQLLLKMDKEHKPHFITDPHISIARKLLPWQYEKGWLELSHTHFSGRFVVDHLILLRKKESEMRYIVLKKFRLLHQQVISKQGELFK